MDTPTYVKPINETLFEGNEIDGFIIGEKIHDGGMAHIFSASKRGIDASIVLKIPKVGPQQPIESFIGFETELNVLSALTSPFVPIVFGSSDITETPYLALQRLSGHSLQELLNQGKIFSVDEVVDLGIQLATALDSIHNASVIHHDLKPDNVIIDEHSKLWLIDFGLAHHHFLPDLLTEQGQKGIGSAPYVAPETIFGIRDDARSDLFSAGVILYELLTGILPFEETHSLKGLKKRLWEIPLPPRKLRPETPPWLQEVILTCLEPKAIERLQSASQLRHFLKFPHSVYLTQRSAWVNAPSLKSQIFQYFKNIGYQPRLNAEKPKHNTSLHSILVALETEAFDAKEFALLEHTVNDILRSHAHARVICISALTHLSDEIDASEIDSHSGQVRAHLAQLKNWSAALDCPAERVTCHVIITQDPAQKIVEFANSNEVNLIIIGASVTTRSLIPGKRSAMSTIVENARCSIMVAKPPH